MDRHGLEWAEAEKMLRDGRNPHPSPPAGLDPSSSGDPSPGGPDDDLIDGNNPPPD